MNARLLIVIAVSLVVGFLAGALSYRTYVFRKYFVDEPEEVSRRPVVAGPGVQEATTHQAPEPMATNALPEPATNAVPQPATNAPPEAVATPPTESATNAPPETPTNVPPETVALPPPEPVAASSPRAD